MSSIDNRVVEMQFDNKAFGNGVKDTLNDLKNLKDGLKLEGATSGLDAVSNAASRFSLGSITNAAGEVGQHFSAMSVIAISAIASIVNKAVDAGIQIAKALTIDPVKAGLDSYAEQIDATQVIMANTKAAGTTLPQITATLADLQAYAQQTVYSFSDMTSNIGRFTAAGVGLQPATDAIKGMANVAALSGANTQQMSSAMYQMSQALSSGVIKLQDWNSLSNANMAGQGIQQAIKETAKTMGDHGKAMDAAIKKQGDFRQSLSEGWLTADIYSKAMGVFGGTMDQSTGKFRAFTVEELKAKGYSDEAAKSLNQLSQDALNSAVNIRTIPQLFDALKEEVAGAWSQVFKTIFGDINQATSLFSGIHSTMENLLTGPINALNEVLKGWAKLGGRDAMMAGFKNAWEALGKILGPIHDAFRDIFPPTSAETLVKITKAFADFTAKLIPTPETMNRIAQTFDGLFSVIDIGVQLLKAFGKFIFDIIGHFSTGSGGILKFTAGVGDMLTRLDQAIKAGDIFNKFFGALAQIIEKPIDVLKRFVGIVATLIGHLHLMSGAGGVMDGVKKNFSEMSSFGSKLAQAWNVVKAVFSAVWKAVEPILSGIGSGLKTAMGAVKDFLSGLSFNDLLGVGATGGILGIAFMLKNLVSTIKGVFKQKPSPGGGLFDKVKESLEQLTNTLKSMQQMLKATTLLEIAAAILIMAIAVNTLSKIDAAGLALAVAAITAMMVQLTGMMVAMSKLMGKSKALKMDLLAAGMILIAIAIDILASAVKKLADLSWNDLAKGLTGVVVLLAAVAGAMRLMPEQSKMISSGIGIVLISVAIGKLADSVKEIAQLSWGEITKGLTGVAALLASLALYQRFAGIGSIGDGASLILMAAAIKILASAIGDIAKLSWQDIAKGLATTAGGLILFAGALKLLPKDNVFQAASIVIMAAALKVLASAMHDMADLSWQDIGKGLATTAGGLILIVGALKLMPNTSILNAAALVVMAAALKILASAMSDMGGMSWGDIAKSLVELAGSLLILVVALNAMDGALPGAAALIVAAAGLKVLAGAMVIMGGMSWSDIAAALVALAGALLILATGLTAMMVSLPGALALLAAAPALGMLAVSLTAFGLVSWGDIGKAVVALIGLFAALAIGGALSPLIAMLGGALVVLGAGIAIAGAGILAAGTGINSFADAMTKLSKIDGQGLQNVLDALDGLISKIPAFATAVAMGFVDFAQTIADNASTFGDAAGAMIDQMVRVFNDKLPELVTSMYNCLEKILTTIDDHMPSLVQKGADILVNFLNGIAKNMKRVAQAGTNVVVAFLKAMGDDIPQVVDAGFKMIISVMEGIAKAIRENAAQMRAAAADIGKAIIDGITGGVESNKGGLMSKMEGLAAGALTTVNRVLGIHSPSREFAKVGKFVVEGFAQGLTGNKSKIDGAVKDMVGQLNDAMKTELDDIQTHANKINSVRGQMASNAGAIAEAQRKLNEAINNPISKSKAKNAADRNAANARALQSHNDAVHSAQLSLQKLIDKQKAYQASIDKETAAINHDGDEYWKMQIAKDALNKQLKTEQAHLDSLANQHDALTEKIKNQTNALNDAIKTRDDYNKSLTNSLSTEDAVTKDTKLPDYVKNLQQQIVDVQKFTVAIQKVRKLGLNDTMYKQLLDAGPSASMPFVQQLLTGGKTAVDNINYLGTTLDKAAGVLGKDASSSLYQAGVDAAAGLLKGLKSQDSAIQAEMKTIANGMVAAIKNALGIHSPSRAFAEIGSYSAQGLAKGLSDSADLISQASADAGQTAVDTMKKTIAGLGALVTESVDANPTITPVLDLSNVQAGASSINGLLSGQSLSVSSASARDALAGYTANQAALADAVAAQQAASMTFIQNNNSPKALSQAEIYRQTNNQLSRAKGALASNARKS